MKDGKKGEILCHRWIDNHSCIVYLHRSQSTHSWLEWVLRWVWKSWPTVSSSRPAPSSVTLAVSLTYLSTE